MSGVSRKVGRSLLWLVGGGVQGIIWFWSVGGAFFLSAFTFLIEAPLLFRIPLFIGSFLLSLAAISQTLIWATTQPRSVSSENVPDEVNSGNAQTQIPPADASAVLYPPITDDELSKTHFERRTVYIAELARKAAGIKWKDAVLHNITFVECRIVGPAVLALMNTGQFGGGDAIIDCSFDEGAEVAWRPAWGYESYPGIVGAEDCLFRGCRFTRVGLLQGAQEPAPIKEGNEGTTTV